MTAGSIAVPQIIPLRLPLPGKSKHDIDTNTPVEIKSGTYDVSIHYTLDGSTPDLFRKPGYGESSTLKYRGPFTLPEGKVTLKAIAVTKDGRESGVVTKVFRVEYVPPYLASSDEDNDDDDDENFLKDYAKDIFRQESQEGSVFMTSTSNKAVRKEKNSAWNEATQKLQGIKIEGNNTYKSPKGPRFLNTRLGTPASQQEPSSALQTNRSQFADSTDTSARKTLTSTQIMRIQKETDFLRFSSYWREIEKFLQTIWNDRFQLSKALVLYSIPTSSYNDNNFFYLLWTIITIARKIITRNWTKEEDLIFNDFFETP